MRIVDLSHAITNDTPVYPGDQGVNIIQAGEFEKDGFCDHVITVGSHSGTHVDAPAHMIVGGKELREYPVERFISQAECVDATNGFSPDAIRGLDIEAGTAVIFYTGISEFFMDEKYWHEYIALDDECCQALIDKKVSMVGLDTASADNKDGFPVHKKLLGADILIVENLTNLKELAGKKFEFMALPLKLEKDGAPVRGVARTYE